VVVVGPNEISVLARSVGGVVVVSEN